MLNFVNCRFCRFSRFKPLMVLLCIIVHLKGNKPNLSQQIAKNRYFYGFSETYLFRGPFWGRFWHNPSCAWITALNRYFFAISLFIAADLPSWWHLCIIVWICRFPRNQFASSLPVVWFAWYVLHRFIHLGQSLVVVLRFKNRILNRLFAARIRCLIYWIWDMLVAIIYKSRIISWCE